MSPRRQGGPSRALAAILPDERRRNDERIHNQRINTLFSQHLRRTADGTYEIAIGWDKVTVEIEDTPYVVTRVMGDSGQGFILRLNDESEELLNPTSLSIGQEDVLYCRVKEGAHPARFLRPAYYQLTAYVQEDQATGTFSLQVGNAAFPIPLSTTQK